MKARETRLPSVESLVEQLTERYKDREWSERVSGGLWEALRDSEDPEIDRILAHSSGEPYGLYRMPNVLLDLLAGVVFSEANTMRHYREIRNERNEVCDERGKCSKSEN